MKEKKIIYSILKEIKEHNGKMKRNEAPSASTYGIGKREFLLILEMIEDNQFIKSTVKMTQTTTNQNRFIRKSTITLKGLEFIISIKYIELEKMIC